MSIAELSEVVRGDPRYQRYLSIRKSAARLLPYEALSSEISLIQQARRVRSLQVSTLQPRDILDISLDEVSHRARLTEILVTAKRSYEELDGVVSSVSRYITANYSSHVSDLRTKGERDNVISTLFTKGYELLSSMDNLATQCELVIKEIDQTSFSLTRIANLYELVIRRESIVNVSV